MIYTNEAMVKITKILSYAGFAPMVEALPAFMYRVSLFRSNRFNLFGDGIVYLTGYNLYYRMVIPRVINTQAFYF